MAETSFPVVDEPLGADQWGSVTLGIGSGVLDAGDFPYVITNVSDTNNTLDISVGSGGIAHAIVNGFYHKIDANMTLSVPAVSSATTYTIALQYDPLNATLPVSLGVFTGELDRDQGKVYLVLHEGVRQPSTVLSAVSWTTYRPRVSPPMMAGAVLPPVEDVLHGATALSVGDPSKDEAQIHVAIKSSGTWKKIYDQSGTFEWTTIPNAGAWVSPGSTGGYQRAIGRRGKERKLRGRLALTDGVFEAGVRYEQPFGSGLAVGDRPSATQAFVTATSNSGTGVPGYARIEIDPSGGVLAWVGQATAWISLDGVEWEAA